jgi:CheY-like chemotaxis protein
MMGGKIEAESVAGEGSTFYFSLPFQPVTEPTLAVGEATPGQQVSSSDFGSGDEPPVHLNILIAEDNDKNQKLLRAYLGKTGHTLTVVEDGLSAVEKVEQEKFDIVLMDVRMPKMDGLTATRTIRERERRLGLEPLPILAITADAGVDESVRSLSAGCNAHLTKPISKGTLISAIRKHTRERNSEAGPYSIDWRDSGRVSKG